MSKDTRVAKFLDAAFDGHDLPRLRKCVVDHLTLGSRGIGYCGLRKACYVWDSLHVEILEKQDYWFQITVGNQGHGWGFWDELPQVECEAGEDVVLEALKGVQPALWPICLVSDDMALLRWMTPRRSLLSVVALSMQWAVHPGGLSTGTNRCKNPNHQPWKQYLLRPPPPLAKPWPPSQASPRTGPGSS